MKDEQCPLVALPTHLHRLSAKPSKVVLQRKAKEGQLEDPLEDRVGNQVGRTIKDAMAKGPIHLTLHEIITLRVIDKDRVQIAGSRATAFLTIECKSHLGSLCERMICCACRLDRIFASCVLNGGKVFRPIANEESELVQRTEMKYIKDEVLYFID